MMEVFKVLTRLDNGRLGSAFQDRHSLGYAPGETTLPPAGWGPLAAFEDEASARAFVASEHCDRHEVWSAEAEPWVGRLSRSQRGHEVYLWRVPPEEEVARRGKPYWFEELPGIGLADVWDYAPPPGTALCAALTPLRRVDG